MDNQKKKQLEQYTVSDEGKDLTTNHGVKVNDDEHSLKAGDRGPTLMEDFHFREKMTHFDHERIPERVVHARGTAAHGVFECYEDASDITMAKFLNEKVKKRLYSFVFQLLQAHVVLLTLSEMHVALQRSFTQKMGTTI